MAERIVVRRKSEPKKADATNAVEIFRAWARHKETEAVSKVQKERIRADSLFPIIETNGEVDEKGSFIFTFPQAVSITSINADDVKKTVTYVGVKKERRPQQVFQEDKARAWAEKNGVLDQVEITVVTRSREYNFAKGKHEVTEESRTVLNQDAFYILNQEGDLSDKVLDSFFEETVIWALVPIKA